MSIFEPDEHLKQAIRNWLIVNIPQWKDFHIVGAAKYLGVFLGHNAPALTFQGPTEKYLDRVEELASTQAPSLGTILRYNERVASVFSYVAQVTEHPDPNNLKSIEQRGVHKVLKLPPYCMSRQLMHSCEPFLLKAPVAITSMCKAAMYRFARAESVFLNQLKAEALCLLKDDQSLVGATRDRVPLGGLPHTPILESLLDALGIKGSFAPLGPLVKSCPDLSWVPPRTPLEIRENPGGFLGVCSVLDSRHVPPLPLPPSLGGKVQGKIYECFSKSEKCGDFAKAMSQKLVVTLGVEVSSSLRVPVNWVATLLEVLRNVRPHTASCVFKSLIGGWTTSVRMHEHERLSCIFGCREQPDEINHYFLCSPLWQIAGQSLQVQAPLCLAQRLCIELPTPESARLLALVFALYHFCKTRAKELGGAPVIGPNAVQRIAFEAAIALEDNV